MYQTVFLNTALRINFILSITALRGTGNRFKPGELSLCRSTGSSAYPQNTDVAAVWQKQSQSSWKLWIKSSFSQAIKLLMHALA